MFWVPTSVALRATLLPVSVSMYSPLGGLRDDILADCMYVDRGLVDFESWVSGRQGAGLAVTVDS
jgi:hypothetical protein